MLSKTLNALLLICLSFSCSLISAAENHPNVLLICVDDLRPELKSFGKEYIHSPNIDQLAQSGRAFQRHYVQAPTCGASRYTLLTGRYGTYGNHALFARAAEIKKNSDKVPPSMPAWFREHGYKTVSVGKVSHHPGGRGGSNWDDDSQPEMPNSWDKHLLPAGPWQHPRGAMHGLANGEIRGNAKQMALFQATPGPDTIYPDGLIVEESLNQMDQLIANNSRQPFFLAVGIIRPHLPFGAPKKYLDLYEGVDIPEVPHPGKPSGQTTWHSSGEFMKYNRWGRNPNDDAEFAKEVRRHYAACVSYADAQVGKLLKKLDDSGVRENTIVVLWGDHGWHLGEHAIWGKHALFEESLHSPLIIQYQGVPHPGESTNSIVETIDIFPTLCDLTGMKVPSFVDGVSLKPILDSPDASGHAAISYTKAKTIRTDKYRMILHPKGHVELYDHASDEKETKNIVEQHPQVVKELKEQLLKRLAK